MRQAQIKRKTQETEIDLSLNLDGSGQSQIQCGVGFLEHMLTLLAKHGRLDLNLMAKGDLEVDCHHTVEDIGICLGQALRKALGEGRGIVRYGQILLPMDEALALVALDISGRGFLAFEAEFPASSLGSFDTEMVEEFFRAVALQSGITLHIRMLAGKNTHHICEAIFKGFARALAAAAALSGRDEIPSSKGKLI
ncbi:MAG: imidazoleglycerol-phosphate dehydratase HisB [Clostridia bacterium]|nr:imidazoleglycerol-phosphate dehydratase HisB [Clostridia bacterium]